MNPRTRERIKRVLLADLLRSELSPTELKELRKALNDEVFLMELAGLIDGVIDQLRAVRPQKFLRDERSFERRAIHELVQRKRMSKKDIHSVLASSSRKYASKYKFSNMRASKQMIQDYLRIASGDEILKVLDWLNAGSYDPYLRGITKRGVDREDVSR
ncbi:MAG: hypothetical protein KF835_02050 [Xanthobacteraceae bacterium]|nr:hypothetical protein [Xanthobacteraceae bacterium]